MHDVNARRVTQIGIGIGAVVALCVVAVLLLLRAWDTPASGARLPPHASPPVAQPVLDDAPQLDLERYRAEKRRLLESTGWVDAQRGIARIPIAAAMAMLASPAPAASAPEARR